MKFVVSASVYASLIYAFSSANGAYAETLEERDLKRRGPQDFIKGKAGFGDDASAAKGLDKDNEAYWSRFLQDMSMTPPPTPPPPPTTEECTVSIETGCEPPDGADDCNGIPVPTQVCEQRPTALVMKYNGGDCEQSFNMQSESLFACQDFNGGPPLEGASYIRVTDIKGQSIIYFEGFVPVGDQFLIADGGNIVVANMNVTVYETDDLSPDNIQQTLVFHSSCSRNLFLKDIFGSIQLAVFVNEAQGVVSCFIDVEYSFSIVNEGMFDVTLESLISRTNLGVFDLTDEVVGQEVGPGDTFVVAEDVTLDLTERMRYTALTTITGSSSTGDLCTDTDFLSFVAGNPTAPGFPTAAPSPFGLPTP